MAQASFASMFVSSVLSLRSGPVTRRAVFLAIVACIFIVYVGPLVYRRITTSLRSSTDANACLSKHLKAYESELSELDAFVEYSSKDEKTVQGPLQFVGNGKLGAVIRDVTSLYLFYEVLVQHTDYQNQKKVQVMRAEQRALRLPFNPMIRINHGSDLVASASIINLREGTVKKLKCLKMEEYSRTCVFLNHTVVAHRSRPYVFLQHIAAYTDTSSGSVGMKIDDINVSNDEFADNVHFKKEYGDLPREKRYRSYSGVMKISNGEFMAVSIASHVTGQTIRVTNDKSDHIDGITVIMNSDIKPDYAEANRATEKVVKRAVRYLTEMVGISTDELIREHREAWKDILHTGLTLSTGHEPGIPDPSVVNATLYYVLSSSLSKLHDDGIPEKERRDLVNRLQTPDFCYQGHPTFHGHALWKQVNSVEEVVDLQRLWSLTLSKQNCKSLVSEGAEGLLQAMLLSFGGLKFTEHDLRLETDADVLHNDIAFHRIIYRNDTVDISIKWDAKSKKPMISVSLRENSRVPLYACEAGCMHDAIQLSVAPQELPVFVTDPVTSILYISHDRQHLSDLQHTLHVRKIVNHAEHMEAIRKGAGIPNIFWVGIGSLIIFFHLFLIRLLCNEYKTSSYSAPYYGGVGSVKHFGSRSKLAS